MNSFALFSNEWPFWGVKPWWAVLAFWVIRIKESSAREVPDITDDAALPSV